MANEVITIENLSEFKTKYDQKVSTSLSGKQDTISDLATIRSGASAGATAVQPDAISDMATEQWVQDQGYLTEHQSLEGLMAEDKLTIEDGKITEYDGTPFAGQGGGGSDIVVFNDSNPPTVTKLDDAIAANKAICVIHEGRDYMFNKRTGNWYYFYSVDATHATLYEAIRMGESWRNVSRISLAQQSWVDSQGFAKASDIPTIPTNVGAFTNDVGYLTEHQSLANYATIAQVAAKQDKLTDVTDIQLVSSLPSNPDATVLYLIPEA